jgi:hypothetical protein
MAFAKKILVDGVGDGYARRISNTIANRTRARRKKAYSFLKVMFIIWLIAALLKFTLEVFPQAWLMLFHLIGL